MKGNTVVILLVVLALFWLFVFPKQSGGVKVNWERACEFPGCFREQRPGAIPKILNGGQAPYPFGNDNQEQQEQRRRRRQRCIRNCDDMCFPGQEQLCPGGSLNNCRNRCKRRYN